ncbi:MAG: amidase family protein, partial [Thermoanaerobaculia bacterium]
MAARTPSRACPASGGSSPSAKDAGLLISIFATAVELGRRLRRREISSVELTRLFLDRLGALGPRYNALAELTPDLALTQARRADRLLRRGDAASPLLGVPYGAKDL